MAEITVKRMGELVRGVFRILMENEDGLRAKEVLKQLEQVVSPSDFEKADYPKHPGIRRYEQLVRFSTIGPVKAGWMEKSKGRWILTDHGRKAYKEFSDPEKFKRESDRLYSLWADKNESDSESRPSDKEIEAVNVTYEAAEEQAWSDVERYFSNIDPYEFQNELVVGLLKGMGYFVAHAAPPGADGGVDVIAYPDPLGTKEPTVKVSVRRRSAKADSKDLREFVSRLHAGEVGIFISVSGFTSEAERECRAEHRKIRLLDLEKFFDLWTEHYEKIPEIYRKKLPIKPVWFLGITRD